MSKIDLDERVEIQNLCVWPIYFRRIEGQGDIKISAKSSIKLSRSEIQSQVFDNNVMFTGTDGKGSHARVYINDKPTRELVEFENEEEKITQQILTKEKIEYIINLKTKTSFEKNVKENVVTHAEKALFIEEARKLKLNDFDKVKFIEDYTGFKFKV